jgi:hypothetical protein
MDLIIIRLLVLEKIVVKKEKIKKKKTKITGKTVKKVYGRVKLFLRKINSITIDICHKSIILELLFQNHQ